MRLRLQIGATILALLHSAAIAIPAFAAAASPAIVELALPRPIAAGEAVWLQIRAGALPRRAEIRISTSDGALLGTVSPIGARGTQEPAYTIPLPTSVIVHDRVRVRVEIEENGMPIRAPAPGEIESVTLLYVPVTN